MFPAPSSLSREFRVLVAGLALTLPAWLSQRATAAETPLANPAPEFRYLCQDAGAGGYESFPDLCRLRDGRILAVFYAGWDHVALPRTEWPRGGRIVSSISSDEGRTWSPPRVVIDTKKDDRDPSITQLSSGQLACTYFTREPSGAVDTWVVFSTDASLTWSDPQLVAKGYAVSSPIRQVSGGRLLLGIYSEDETTHQAFGAVTRSDDHGRSWSAPSVIDNAGARLDAETVLIELKDGTLWAAQRGGSGAAMHSSVSRDRGETWSRSAPLGFQAHCPYLHRLPDGTLLLATREFDPGPWKGGTAVRFSRDEAKSWSQPFLIDRCSGSYPSMVTLADGSTLIAYYEEKSSRADVRVRRFRLHDDAIELLPLEPLPVSLGTRREVFVDRFLIDHMTGLDLRLQNPTPAGTALTLDRPWEGIVSGYFTVLQDGDRFRMYYRGRPSTSRLDASAEAAEVTCLAESRDGIQWTRPDLGLFKVAGTRRNNVVLVEPKTATHNFCPFLDTRPGVPGSERYKAVGGTGDGLFGFTSSDGIHWKQVSPKPMITAGQFDSQNVVFWSESEHCYVCYFRTWKDTVRWISRSESADFLHWSLPAEMTFGDAPNEHLYINQTLPYFRAPHLYLGLAARFNPGRRALTETQVRALDLTHPRNYAELRNDDSDAVLLSSRGGTRYERTFLESFIRPGQDPRNWVARANYPALGLIQTSTNELSCFVLRHYGQPSIHLERMTLRLDGFASVHAGYAAGELITRPLRFLGTRLEVNLATSAAGFARFELQDAVGRPLPDFTMEESAELIGDSIGRTVHWKTGSSLSALAGRTVRLRIQMKDADLYAIQFPE